MSTPRTAAIFGATSDIAAAAARRYAEAGWRLALIGRDPDALVAAAADLQIRGAPAVRVHVADFAQTSSLPGVATAAWDAFGGLDVALIAYGTLPDQARAEQDRATCEAALLLNFASPILLVNELARLFAAQRSGTLAVISSVAGDRGRASNFLYGAAKGGLQRYLEGLRHRLSKVGVAVLDIRPGFVATKMTSALSRGGPLWATPDQVAADILSAIAKPPSRALHTMVLARDHDRGSFPAATAVPPDEPVDGAQGRNRTLFLNPSQYDRFIVPVATDTNIDTITTL